MPQDHDYTSGRDISGEYKLNEGIKIGEKAVYEQITKFIPDPKNAGEVLKEKADKNRIWYCTYRECFFEGWVLGARKIDG